VEIAAEETVTFKYEDSKVTVWMDHLSACSMVRSGIDFHAKMKAVGTLIKTTEQ
jgi:alpha-D-ribose 1-methylphosphonate 5-triphosphate synthase subunit PhnH